MKIWMMNHYAGIMRTNKGGRHYWFAKFLRQYGYDSTIFCAGTQKELMGTEMAEEINTPFVYVKAGGSRNSGLKRVWSMVSFYLNAKKAGKQYAKEHGKPDIILASSVHPLTLVAGLHLAKKFKVKCICEMRDLWPEAILTYSNKIKKNGLIAKLLYAGEKWIYTKADALIFTQEGGADYLRSQGWTTDQGGSVDIRKAFHINNGVDLDAFDKNVSEFVYSDEDLDNPDLYKVIYAGAIRPVNNLDLIVDAAKLITDPKVKFIIFGDGNLLPKLRQRLIDENITNVVFKGKVNKQYIPSIECRADLNLAHWRMTPLVVKLGESCNKVFEYCAAGKPMFYTVHPSYSIAKKFDCGILTKGFTASDIADGIMECANLSAERKAELSRNARTAAEFYDFKRLTQDLVNIIEDTK